MTIVPERGLVYLVVISTLLAPLWTITEASTPHAAVLTVIHSGVAIQRANTGAWLPLTSGSVAPFGAGDRLRTDETGRAFVSFEGESVMLVLPGSIYQLEQFEVDDSNGIQFAGSLSGVAVHRMASVSSYRLTMQNAVITHPATLFATWAETQSWLAVTAAEGRLELTVDGASEILQAGQGLFSREGSHEIVTFDPPWNAARMQGMLEGCPGTVDTIGDVPLRVRVGPGEGYVRMGGFDEAQPVRIMAVNKAFGWYRIQFLSDFGWLLRIAVQTTCENVPVLPNDTIEQPLYILDAGPDEIDLLQPFFGSPIINGWFYQWTD